MTPTVPLTVAVTITAGIPAAFAQQPQPAQTQKKSQQSSAANSLSAPSDQRFIENPGQSCTVDGQGNRECSPNQSFINPNYVPPTTETETTTAPSNEEEEETTTSAAESDDDDDDDGANNSENPEPESAPEPTN